MRVNNNLTLNIGATGMLIHKNDEKTDRIDSVFISYDEFEKMVDKMIKIKEKD